MGIRIFVTATNTAVGKTYTTCRLMEKAYQKGWVPAAIKPIETGVGREGPADGRLLLQTMKKLNPSTRAMVLEEIVPYRFSMPASPFVAKKEKSVSMDRIQERIERLASSCDILFIEGAGGLMVPIDERTFMIDLPKRFGARTLLLGPSRLGSINDTLLSMEALRSREIAFDLAINLYEEAESFETITRPFYRAQKIAHYLFPKEIDRYLDDLIGQDG
ncbi:dethiobiotin synthase [Hydrogenimonas urashimensis]|uniref:dethiobiotin synthase n=1 Tax=Hydrogenimonas urashimensis TaxID=2740515 RepID=UPI001915447F|nr:dethiobiotin synthase [Hydrogenimonas urashimensis]